MDNLSQFESKIYLILFSIASRQLFQTIYMLWIYIFVEYYRSFVFQFVFSFQLKPCFIYCMFQYLRKMQLFLSRTYKKFFDRVLHRSETCLIPNFAIDLYICNYKIINQKASQICHEKIRSHFPCIFLSMVLIILTDAMFRYWCGRQTAIYLSTVRASVMPGQNSVGLREGVRYKSKYEKYQCHARVIINVYLSVYFCS